MNEDHRAPERPGRGSIPGLLMILGGILLGTSIPTTVLAVGCTVGLEGNMGEKFVLMAESEPVLTKALVIAGSSGLVLALVGGVWHIATILRVCGKPRNSHEHQSKAG